MLGALNEVADRLLGEQDKRSLAGGEDVPNVRLGNTRGGRNPLLGSGRIYEESADGILAAWKDCV